MAIHFEWYENPVPPNRPDEKKLHARITYNGKVGTDYVRRKIQERCSLTETDVTAVLDALSHVLGQELGDGRQVHLDGIGYFHPTLKCIEEVTAETKRKNTKVRLKGIKFRADQALKNEVGAVKLKNIKHDGHSSKLSDVEIDMRSVLFCRPSADDPCRLPTDLRIYEVEGYGTYPQIEVGRKNTEYRAAYAADICACGGIVTG